MALSRLNYTWKLGLLSQLTVIPDKISVQICQDLNFPKSAHRISKNIFVLGSYECLEELKG